VLTIGDVPRRLLSVVGRTHSQRIAHTVQDVLRTTDLDNQARIVMSSQMEQALVNLRDFLWDRVYENPTVHDEFKKCHAMLQQLYQLFLEDPAVFHRVAGHRGSGTRQRRRARERAICDFIAGMTDRYATRLFETLFVPRPWPVDQI
jgi:dGTPase